jgi:hypothetical protein
MRRTFKITCKGITFFIMLSHTQTLRGITSKINNKDEHLLMWDLEECSIHDAEKELKRIQEKYNLSTIYIMSDKEKSYRGICFTGVPFLRMLHIISDTKYIDFMFVKYTCIRQRASLRFSPKKDRGIMKIVSILPNPEMDVNVKIPNQMEIVEYDTGLQKASKEIHIKIGKGVYEYE